MLIVLEGVVAVNAGAFHGQPGEWVAWDTCGPVRGTESATAQVALERYDRLKEGGEVSDG